MPRLRLLLAPLLLAASAATAATAEVDHAREYRACLALVSRDSAQASAAAAAWAEQGGGAAAEHCAALALVERGHYDLAAQRLERIAARLPRDSRIPPAQLRTALRGWSQDVDAVISSAGGDPGATYALVIANDGATRVQARDFAGASLEVAAPRFPITTPLRRIDVTHVAPYTGGRPALPDAAPSKPEPL